MSVDDFHGLLALAKEDRGRYRGIRDVYVFKRERGMIMTSVIPGSFKSMGPQLK